ncbi:MAG: serine hydrolase [Flavobacteriales bacterium]|nr:serine hydrolase [Flavobacteriales bacterium]
MGKTITLYIFACLLLGSGVQAQDRIDSLLKATVPNDEHPGVIIGVVKSGELIYHGFRGSMNRAYQVPFNDSTVFGLASVTKQFTAAGIGVLVHQGRLSVEDDIRVWVPEMKDYGETIRIKHLLNHTSGIRNHNVLLDLSGFDYEHRGYTNAMIQELMFQQEGINNAPGEKMLYSNTNYVLLALIIERASGLDYHQFLKREIFNPLGMKDSFIQSDLHRIIENVAVPHYIDNDQFKTPKSLTLCVGAGGMGSTVEDLANWSQVLLAPSHPMSYLGSFLTEQDQLPNGQIMANARGLFIADYQGYKTIHHGGRDLGMRSQFICIPQLDLAVIVYTNSEDINANALSYEVIDCFINPAQKNTEEQTSTFTHSGNFDSFIGTYQELNSDLRMNTFEEQDTLKAISSFGREPNTLVAVSETNFQRSGSASVHYNFAPDPITQADLLVDFGGATFYFERIELNPQPTTQLKDFTGTFHSKELNTTYQLHIEEGQLILQIPNRSPMALKEGQKDEFGANRRTRYTFHRNENGEVVSFEVASEGTVKGILFYR